MVIGILLRDKALIERIIDGLDTPFGPLDLVSPWLPFDFTEYYAQEMGAPLHRRMLAYKGLVAQDRLPAFKHITNRIETELAVHDRRRVNIDPGLLLPERFVLATGKNFTHRIYLGQGIYADLTLIYRQGGFQTLPWTYPDYADGRLQDFLLRARRKLQHDRAATDGARQNAAFPRQLKGNT
jgi:hypothetical protein